MATMKVGLVGCGNIASDICLSIREKDVPADVVALVDIDASQAESLRREHKLNACIGTLEEAAGAVDFIVECATPAVVPEVVDAAMRHHADCLVMSVGGLLEHPELFEAAKRNHSVLLVPSGAICGLDGIRNAMQAGLDKVTLTTRKPPRGLQGAPHLVAKNINLDGITEPVVVFDGTAREAVKAFPANINVAAALSLAGLGPDKTRIRIVADPNTTVNTHEIYASGPFGELTAVVRNQPSPRNPKSSYMASLSACAEVAAAAASFAARRG